MRIATLAAVALAVLAALDPRAAGAEPEWEPGRPVQLVVPAGIGGGGDRMARLIQAIVARHGLMRYPIVVVNKPGGAGAEAFLEARAARGNPHLLVITLSNLFTTPLATGIPFNWRDLTPVAMLALDEFVLWVNAEAPFTTLSAFLAAARADRLRIGGTGSRQEDQIITAAISRESGIPFTYVPYPGGGAVVAALVARHVDATVNNPIEAVTSWRAGRLRPLCVFDRIRLTATGRMTATEAWSDIPTCRESGLDVEYLMLRGIFMASGVTAAQVRFYAGLLDKVSRTEEWQELMRQGAFNRTVLAGQDFVDWLSREEARHRALMEQAGFLASR